MFYNQRSLSKIQRTKKLKPYSGFGDLGDKTLGELKVLDPIRDKVLLGLCGDGPGRSVFTRHEYSM